jgi:hypothetical protein
MTAPDPLSAGGGFPDDFYGFREVPFHVHLGMTFERPDPSGPAVVTLPAQPHLLDRRGAHSPAAAYTVGEVASGISVCDALALHGAGADTDLMPLVLTKRTVFRPATSARGDLRSRARFVGESGEAAERLRSSRKVSVEVACTVLGEGEQLAGEVHVYFYVRLMQLSRLEAMAGQLMPAMAERARAVLGLDPARA